MTIEHPVVPAIAPIIPQGDDRVFDQIAQLCSVLTLVERIADTESNRPPVDQATIVHDYCHARGIAQRRVRTVVDQATTVAETGVNALINPDGPSSSIAAACLAAELRSVLATLAPAVGR